MVKPVFCALLSVILISGCTRKTVTPSDTLVMALSANAPTLDPRYATDAVGSRIVDLIFSSLVRLGPDLMPAPDAAERWTLKGNTYTFTLRPGLVFHNGRKLTREDVEFSFAVVRDARGSFASSMDLIKSVAVREKEGRLIVDVELKTLSEKFIKSDIRAVKLLPKEEVLKAGPDFARVLIGTGPFKFVRQDAAEIELEGVSAAIKHLLFKVIHDDFTRYQKMMKGEVDIAQMEITPDRVADFEKRPDEFQVFLYPGLSMSYILVNFRDPLLAKRPVREALSRAINREEIIRYKLHGMATEATSLISPVSPYHAPGLKNPAFDVAAAKALMPHTDRGELVLKTSNSPQAVDNGKVLAYQLSRAGVKVRLQSYEWGTFYGDVKRGDFQLATMKWVGVIDPDIYKLALHSSETPPGRNRGSYKNPEVDKLIEAGTNETDTNKRRDIFIQAQRLAHDDLAVIPLWYERQIAVARKNVINYRPNPTGDYSSLERAYKN